MADKLKLRKLTKFSSNRQMSGKIVFNDVKGHAAAQAGIFIGEASLRALGELGVLRALGILVDFGAFQGGAGCVSFGRIGEKLFVLPLLGR